MGVQYGGRVVIWLRAGRLAWLVLGPRKKIKYDMDFNIKSVVFSGRDSTPSLLSVPEGIVSTFALRSLL